MPRKRALKIPATTLKILRKDKGMETTSESRETNGHLRKTDMQTKYSVEKQFKRPSFASRLTTLLRFSNCFTSGKIGFYVVGSCVLVFCGLAFNQLFLNNPTNLGHLNYHNITKQYYDALWATFANQQIL